MKALLFACLLPLISCPSGAQTPTPPLVVEGTGLSSWVQAATPGPSNAHDYALSRIKEFSDYRKARGSNQTTDFIFSFIGGTSPGKEQSVSVTDGKIDLNNLTLEDAFLLVYSSQVDEQLTREKEWDRNEKEREERIASKPPEKMKVGPNKWDVHNLPSWSNDGTVMADTNCALKRIRILETGYNKPDSMLHEMLHAATGCSPNLELHRTIYAMTPKLLKMLQQNPDLVAYLTTVPGVPQVGQTKPSDITALMEAIAPTEPKPTVEVEPITRSVLHCPDGWRVEVWHKEYCPNCATFAVSNPFIIQQGHPAEYHPYSQPTPLMAVDDDTDMEHPPRCVKEKAK